MDSEFETAMLREAERLNREFDEQNMGQILQGARYVDTSTGQEYVWLDGKWRKSPATPQEQS